MPRCLLLKRSFGLGKTISKMVKVVKHSKKSTSNPNERNLKKKPEPGLNSKNSAKIPITMRFHLNYFTKKSFTPDFIQTGSYEYASDYSFNVRKNKGKTYQYDDFITLPDTGEIMKNSKPAKFETKKTLKNSGNSNEVQIKRAKIILKKTESQIRNDRKNVSNVKSAKNIPIIENNNVVQAENRKRSDTLRNPIQDNHLNFQMPWPLDGHLTLLTGETPFFCSFNGCSKTFTDGSNLRAHQRNTHHHAWKWVCLNCSKLFSLERYLNRHKETGCAKYSLQNYNLLSKPRNVTPVKIVLANYAAMNDEIQKLAYTLSCAY